MNIWSHGEWLQTDWQGAAGGRQRKVCVRCSEALCRRTLSAAFSTRSPARSADDAAGTADMTDRHSAAVDASVPPPSDAEPAPAESPRCCCDAGAPAYCFTAAAAEAETDAEAGSDSPEGCVPRMLAIEKYADDGAGGAAGA